MTVSIEQKWEGYEEHYGLMSKGGATQYVTCAWSDRVAAVTQLLYTASTHIPWLYCTGVNVKPVGDADSSAGGPKTALLTVTYEDPRSTYGFVSNDWAFWKEHWEGGGEAVTVGSGFKWSDTGASINADEGVSAVKIIPQATITVTGRTTSNFVTGKTRMIACGGKVNVASFTLFGTSYPAETVLFNGADVEDGTDGNGVQAPQISFKFAVMYDHTWNQVWRATTTGAGWAGVLDNTGAAPYQTVSDMNTLNPKYW